MKIFKFLALLTISVLLFTGCEKEEITNYAFQEISAPTNVMANFDVAQDDSGEVIITPSGEGAQVFQVYFGDGDSTPVEVEQGESVSYTYEEGEYLVRVVAVGSTGLTSEFNQRLLISFKTPENLVINVDQAASNPAMVTVSASADFAATFDVYFGENEDEEPTQLMPDGSVEYTYANPGTYTIRVVAKGAGAATIQDTVEVVVPEANDPVKLPITFEDATVNYAVTGFGAADFGPIPAVVIDNPDASGINTSDKVLSVNKTVDAQVFAGASIPLEGPIDFTNGTTISLKVWSPRAGTPILFKIEDSSSPRDANGNPTVFVEIQVNSTLVNTWEELTIDLTSSESFSTSNSYDTVIVFPDFGTAGKGELFYFDDIQLATDESEPVKLPITFDDDLNYIAATSGTDFTVVSNPQQSGINSSATMVGAITNAGQQFEALTVNLDEAIDFSGADKTITMKVYSEIAYPVLFKLETGVNGERANEVEVNHGGTGWELLTFNFATNARKSFVNGDPENGAAFVPTGQYNSFSIFLDFAGTSAGTFYIDDILKSGSGIDGGGPVASTKTSFPVNLETAANGGAAANWSVFENADNPGLEIISNPDASGANNSATVAKFTARQGGAPFAGTITQLQTPLTLSASNSIVKILVWKSVISDVGIKFENAAGGSTGEIKVSNTKTNEWEELTFDFSGVVGDPNNTDITGLVVFPDFKENRAQDNIVYFDNITLNAAGSGGGTSGETNPTAAAPTPSVDAANVISLFSDAYTDVPVDTWRTSWSAADYTETTVAGNDVKLYSNLNFVGVETTSNQVDASTMTHFHVDYWTGNASLFRVKLVDFGPDGAFNTGDESEDEIEFTVTPNTWVSLDIPLSDFTELTNTENMSQYIFSAATAGEANVYIDNVYFHN